MRFLSYHAHRYDLCIYYGFLELINETPLSARVHGVPVRGINKKFICGAIWLNNNYLTSLQGLSKSVEELLELPAYLTWIDISYNEFKNIGQVKITASERVIIVR